ncbi:MAG: succinyl-CoA synthetase subunit alpha [Nitrospirae bacterium]|nr:succinyl-CoA synthetase subunit alpha [Nitrospirota bacterium]MBF0541890.1 succinyl-CoA synthetase subunit alpha [Nitrospirota bacterium]
MAEPILLVNDASKYYGLYVAMPSFIDRNVVCSGKDPIKVYKQAKENGYNDPVLFYVPEKDTVLIF